MTVTRSEIVQAARSMLGTPWKHQGRSRKSVDCVGLVYLIAKELGIAPPDLEFPTYRRQPDGSVGSYFDRYMDRIPQSQMKAGSVMLHSFMGSPFHASVVVDPVAGAIIHATASKRAVVIDLFKGRKNGMIFHAAYDYKGVSNG